MNSLERRKNSLRRFYQEVDEGRIKNIDPLFDHFSFSEICAAIKTKYKKLPEGWEYEPYMDWVGHVNSKKIVNVMKKKGLNPAVVLGGKNKPVAFAPEEPMRQRETTLTEPRTRNTKVMIKRETRVTKASDEDAESMFNPPEKKSFSFNASSDFLVSSPKVSDPPPPPGPPPPPPPYDMPGSPIKAASAPNVRGTTSSRGTVPSPPPRPKSSLSVLESQPPPPPIRAPSKRTLVEQKPPEMPVMPANPMQELLMKTKKVEDAKPANPMQELLMKTKKVEDTKPANPMQELLMKTKKVETKNEPAKPTADAPPPPPEKVEIQLNPEDGLDKYRKMKKNGLPEGAIINAMVRDGLDPSMIDQLDGSQPAPPKPAMAKSNSPPPLRNPPPPPQPKVKEQQAVEEKPKGKFAAMHNKLLALNGGSVEKKDPPPRRTNAGVSTAFASMHEKLKLNMGGGSGMGVKKTENVKKDDAKASDVAKKFAAKTKGKRLNTLTPGTEEFEKYTKMQKRGLPEGAIRNCIERDGFDPESFFNAEPAPAEAPAPTPAPSPTPAAAQSVQQQPQASKTEGKSPEQLAYEEAMRKYERDLAAYNQQMQQLQAQNSMQQMVPQQQQMVPMASQHQIIPMSSQHQMVPQQTLPRMESQQQMMPIRSQRQMVQVQGSQMNAQGWSVEWSEQYQRPYYYNHYTRESTWNPPLGM